jgi:protein involved in polysaccharide export with SLBB domain/glycosyltransferase involved in cell wall biosynthesis
MIAPCAFPSARGSQVLIRELAEALAERGHEVHVVTYPSGEHMVPIRGISVHRAGAAWVSRLAILPWLLRKALYDLALVRRLRDIVRQYEIDIIHAHNYEGPVIAFIVRWLTGVPVVYHAHNTLSDELPCYVRGSWLRRLAAVVGRFLDRQIPRRADHAIALTEQLEAFLRKQGVAESNVSVIAPVAPVAVTDSHPPNEGFGDRFVVLYSGNFDPYQDLEVLGEACSIAGRAAPDLLLVLVTHDPLWNERIDDRMRGFLRNAQVIVAPSFQRVRRLLASAHVLVCPRSSWSGYPIKLLNYLAAGRPIVAAQGSAKGLVHNQTALVVPNKSPEALAAALLRIRREPELAGQLAEGALRAAASAPTWASVTRAVEAIYARFAKPPVESPRPARIGGQVQELIGLSRERISAASGGRARQTVRRTQKIINIAVGLFVLMNLAACARQATPSAALPPLDAPLPAPPGQAGPYRLQPGDLLRIKFMYHPELDVKVPIRPDGGVTLQVGGNIHAAGLTTDELERVIVERTSDRLREPEVSVLVAQTADLKVYVMGEVRLPGIVNFREGITPLQAIADRGGFSEVARVDSVLRLSPSEDEYQGTRLDFSRPLEAGSPEGVQLRAGDVLYIPRSFIGDVNSFVRLYVRGLLPIEPRIGAGTTF